MGTIEVEARGPARIVRIVRPQARNALDVAMLRALVDAALEIRRDRNARAVVLTGCDGIFAAGGDLRAFAKIRTAAGGRRLAMRGHEVIDTYLALGLPLIAALNGDAFGGGCELATACDYRIMESQSRLHWVQGRFAVTTAWGATGRLVQAVGAGVTARWLLTAATVTADEATSAGFAHERVETGGSVEAALGLAERISRVSRATVKRQLALIRGCEGRSPAEWRDAEVRAFGAGWGSREHHAAVERFHARPRAQL